MSRRWRNWCQNEVYEERKEADSRDNGEAHSLNNIFISIGNAFHSIRMTKHIIYYSTVKRINSKNYCLFLHCKAISSPRFKVSNIASIQE